MHVLGITVVEVFMRFSCMFDLYKLFIVGSFGKHPASNIAEIYYSFLYCLSRYGHFSGINRKIQFKYQPLGAPKKSSDDDGWYQAFQMQSLVWVVVAVNLS